MSNHSSGRYIVHQPTHSLIHILRGIATTPEIRAFSAEAAANLDAAADLIRSDLKARGLTAGDISTMLLLTDDEAHAYADAHMARQMGEDAKALATPDEVDELARRRLLEGQPAAVVGGQGRTGGELLQTAGTCAISLVFCAAMISLYLMGWLPC